MFKLVLLPLLRLHYLFSHFNVCLCFTLKALCKSSLLKVLYKYMTYYDYQLFHHHQSSLQLSWTGCNGGV